MAVLNIKTHKSPIVKIINQLAFFFMQKPHDWRNVYTDLLQFLSKS